ncbi:MAG: type I 3-dehydroquinate dehydratase [Alkaliphilus sp.]|nr:type I 3-dehydroquinate dehydratase [Alkaliphilus sp.]
MNMEIKVVEVRGKKIGGERPQICVPMVGKTKEQLISEAEIIANIKPDLIEWRVDYYDLVDSIPDVLESLSALREILTGYPIIFTCRIDKEGGYRKIAQAHRLELIKTVIKTKKIDIIDFELINDKEEIREILEVAKANGIYAIISNHDFKETPSIESIIETLIKEQELGADIAKIAVMPNNMEDVLNLLYATNTFIEKHAKVPVIAMSMSTKGLISRIAGGFFGSSVTFGLAKEASAPGQIATPELKAVLDILQKNMK